MKTVCVLLLLLGCGCSGPQQTKNSLSGDTDYDIVAAFDQGKTYSVRSENGTSIDTGTAKTDVVVTVVSDRAITRGGVFGQSALGWTESVTGVEVSGDKDWTSDSGSPPPDDLLSLAALAGSSYSVTITALGETTASDLKIPMPALSEEHRAQVRERLGDVGKVAESLARSVTASLRALPNRRTKVGDSWSQTKPKPSMGDKDATMTIDWKFESTDQASAVFVLTGRYQDASLKFGRVKGTAKYDLGARFFSEFQMTTNLKWKSGATVTTTSRVSTEVR